MEQKTMYAKHRKQEEDHGQKRNPRCPDCPINTPEKPIKDGQVFLSSSNYSEYIFRQGEWVLNLPDVSAKSDAFSSSNPWWQATNTNPEISKVPEGLFAEIKKEQERLDKEAKETERRWTKVSNVLNGIEPVGISSDSDEYCKFYNRYKTVVIDSTQSFQVPDPNCYHAALYQLHLAGWNHTGSQNAFQLFVNPKLNTNLKLSIIDGIEYVKGELLKGNPIMAGATHGEGINDSNDGNYNKKTQHFIILVGMGYDDKMGMNYFSYYDNGFSPKGDLVNNRFYFHEKDQTFRRDSTKKIPDILTEFRVLKEEEK